MKKFVALLLIGICAGFLACNGPDNSGKGDVQEYTITFDPSGGSGGPEPAGAIFGQALPTLTGKAPVYEGFVFSGYYDAQTDGAQYYDADLSPVPANWDKKEDTVLYAHWTPETPPAPDISSKVALVQSETKAHAADLDFDDIKALVTEAVRLAGGLEGIVKPGDTVVLKPNLINSKTQWVDSGGTVIPQLVNGVCTDYRVVKAASELVRDIIGPTGKILVMEGSGKGSTAEHLANMGYTPANLDEVDEIIPLDNEGAWVSAGNAGGGNAAYVDRVQLDNFRYNTASGTYLNYYKNDGVYYVNKKMYEADAFISLPVVKNHWNAVVTGGIKNIAIGASPPRVYGISGVDVGRNNMVNHDSPGFHQWIADYFSCIPADFVIMDGLQGLEYGPLPGSGLGGTTIAAAQKNMRSILASKDALALDVVETNIIDWDYTSVPYLSYLTERGQVGTNPNKKPITVNGKPENITVLGNIKVDDIRTSFAGNLPMAGGRQLDQTDLAKPVLLIQSAVFTGQDLILNLDTSSNTVKIDVYINGDYVRSFNERRNTVTVDASDLPGGTYTVTVDSYTKFMVHAQAQTTAVK